MADEKLTRTWTSELAIDSRDQINGLIRYDDANKGHVVFVELPITTNGTPGQENVGTLVSRIVTDGILTQAELDAWLATWRKLRAWAAAERGFRAGA